MPRACTVCTHPQRPELDAALRQGDSLRVVASRFALNLHAVHRHETRHLARGSATAALDATRAAPDIPDDVALPPRSRAATQRAYLRALRETGNKLEAATAAGIHPSTAVQWAMRDARFAEKVQRAQEVGDQIDLARCEGILRRRINNDQDPASGILLIFRTKRLDPRYRDGSGVTVNAQGPVAISLGLEAEARPQDVGVEAVPTSARRVDPRKIT